MIIERIKEELSCIKQEHRNYLGCSSIGSPCERQIYYEYTGVSRETSSKLALTFEIGRSLESIIMDFIKDASIIILPSKQNECVSKSNAKFKGHCDAIACIDNTFYVIEIKTACNTSYNRLVKLGVKGWNSRYYDQVQCYMGMKEIDKAIVIVVNKDTSELFEQCVYFDRFHYELLCEKANRIIACDKPPKGISDNPMFYYCRLCSYKKICHG